MTVESLIIEGADFGCYNKFTILFDSLDSPRQVAKAACHSSNFKTYITFLYSYKAGAASSIFLYS